MSTYYPHYVDARNTTIGGLRISPQFVNTEGVTEYAEIGSRLAAIRTGFSDLTQKGWADKHGFSQTQYNNWEKGTRRIPVEAAEKLGDLYGVTLDFIYRGRLDALSEKARNVI